MKIIIEQAGIADIIGYRVTITECISKTDELHRVDKVTTSPVLSDKQQAKCWLAKWLAKD